MTVTVVIPTHGRSPYLAEAVESVQGADEILVVEDGTAEASERDLAGARLIRLPRGGRSRARNAGVEAAQTPLVAFVDADDVSLPDRLERQRAALKEAPEAALCFGLVTMVDEQLDPEPEPSRLIERRFARLANGPATFERILATHCPIYTSGTTVRRDAFLEAGGYDPRFDAYEDLDLYLRLSRRGGLVPTPGGPVTLYRLHEQNTPSDLLYANMLGIVAKHLPEARGRERRLLLERRVDALWGLGRFGRARRAAAAAFVRDPLLLADPRFVRRAAGSLLPTAFLRARR
jgi:glycosyltransferase involved in cell wall biosynthesis